MGLQVILNANELNLKDLYKKFVESGYKLYLNPKIEEFEEKTQSSEKLVLLLPYLMDGYLSVIREKLLKAIVITLDKTSTSKFRTYIYSEET